MLTSQAEDHFKSKQKSATLTEYTHEGKCLAEWICDTTHNVLMLDMALLVADYVHLEPYRIFEFEKQSSEKLLKHYRDECDASTIETDGFYLSGEPIRYQTCIRFEKILHCIKVAEDMYIPLRHDIFCEMYNNFELLKNVYCLKPQIEDDFYIDYDTDRKIIKANEYFILIIKVYKLGNYFFVEYVSCFTNNVVYISEYAELKTQLNDIHNSKWKQIDQSGDLISLFNFCAPNERSDHNPNSSSSVPLRCLIIRFAEHAQTQKQQTRVYLKTRRLKVKHQVPLPLPDHASRQPPPVQPPAKKQRR